MNNKNNDMLKVTVDVVINIKKNLSFTLLEVGADQIHQDKEPFYELLDYFPSSKIIGFELDQKVCDDLNTNAPKGIRYYPHALGEFNEKRKLYIANHPMCSSLYEPNEKLISLYNNFEVAYLKSESTLETISLGHFLNINNINSLDFIKIDVQGAELDNFKGSTNQISDSLKNI